MFSKKKFGITPEQFIILSILDDNATLHQMQLCELLYKDSSNMTRLISILESKNLVKKLPSVDKRLVNKIQITEQGKELKNIIVPEIKKSRNKILNGITDEELNYCIGVLLKIQNNLNEISEIEK
jgi:DNA-binding MarR family transcriptional regulator